MRAFLCASRFGLVLALVLAALPLSAQKEPDPAFANLDFEDGKEPWKFYWFPGEHGDKLTPFEWGIDSTVARSGKASLKVIADRRRGRASIHQTTEKFKKGARYEISYWLKVTSPDMLDGCELVVTFHVPKADGKGTDQVQVIPVVPIPVVEKGWYLRRGAITVPAEATSMQTALRVQYTTGTVWFDDIQLREMKPGDLRVEALHEYAQEQTEHGEAMVERFRELEKARSPFLDRAKVYNQLLVDVAHLSEDARRLQRCNHYLKGADIAAELQAAGRIEPQLDALYQTYGKLFLGKKAEGLDAFDREADALKIRLAEVRKAVAFTTAGLQQKARDAGARWTVPPEPKEKPIVVSPAGKPNQLVFGTVSLNTHYEMEEPLTVNRVWNMGIFDIKGEGPGKYDFSRLTDGWKYLQKRGATHATINTAFAVHSGTQEAPAWFLKKYADDSDIMLRGADGAKADPPSWAMGKPLNTWRPEVRDMTKDMLAQLGGAMRNQPQFLWYVVAPENGGPYFVSEKGLRATGYNASALPDFHAWLQKRYGTVADLNKQWQSRHARFEDIKPPDDLLIVNEWKRPHPLGYEFQTWRLDHHHHWLKFIYDELKKADPTKPVMTDPNTLPSPLDGSRLFETADIVSQHGDRDYRTMLGQIYLYSMNRYEKKHLGLHEGMAASQDTLTCGDERMLRAVLSKYLFRLTTWGMHVQMWWYAYTSNEYMARLNGNWFNPLYDLSTLRYSAAAVPVGKAKVKRLEDVILSATIVPSRIAVLQPNTSMLFQNYWTESHQEMDALHKLLYPRNDLYELLPETYFTGGKAKLDDFDVVVLPYAPYLPDGFSAQLSAWVKKGGLLVALGPCGLYDKFGNDRPELWKEAFGPVVPVRRSPTFPYYEQSRDWHWTLDDGKAGADVLEKPLGKGKVIATMRSLGDGPTRDRIAPRLLEAVEAKARRAARSPSNALEMTVQQTPDGKKYLCVLNTSLDKTVSETVFVAGEFKRGIDLDVPGGFPIRGQAKEGETAFELHLGPAEFTIIALE